MARSKRNNGTPGAHSKTGKRNRLRVSIIGVGRLGTTLGRALKLAGYRIDLVTTNHAASARRAAAIIGAKTRALSWRQVENSSEAVQGLWQSDLIVISTPDDAIATVAQQLANLFRHYDGYAKRGAKIALHTSGALSSEVLTPLGKAGFSVGSLHPLISVAGSGGPREIFRGTYFCIEGDRAALRTARAIVQDLGGQSFSVHKEAKPLYHAAATMSSGHLTALIDLATEVLERCGLSRRRATQILLPLIESAVTNLATKAPANALTGPLARGDYATAQKHLAAMKAHDLPEAARVYATLGIHALALARNAGANREQIDRIARLLTAMRGEP